MKAFFSEIGNRALAHWKTSLVGAVEGSGLTAASLVTGDPMLRKGMLLTAGYLFFKGLLVKDAK